METKSNFGALFAFSRQYASLSLIAILVTAIALAVLYRELSVITIVELGERGNLTVARTTLHAAFPELHTYLENNETVTASETVAALPARLSGLLRTAVQDTPIDRIKIYNRNGIILYSSLEHQNGATDSVNPLFQLAIQGQIQSKLRYRDIFNTFGPKDNDDNLIETYFPIRQAGKPEPIGVLELYTDIEPVVRFLTRNELMIMAGITASMTILYIYLLHIVRRSEKIITEQRQVILERNQTLQALSSRMLGYEETERRRVAYELHEQVLQNLCALKLEAEGLTGTSGSAGSLSDTDRSREILPLVRSAIQDVRALAMELRPSVLDDFGLVAATLSLCRVMERAHGKLTITVDIKIQEDQVPQLLKNVIFRITQQTLNRLVSIPGISDVRVSLEEAEGLHFVIDFKAETKSGPNGDEPTSWEDEDSIRSLWERAVLAGGSFSSVSTDEGRFRYQATWTS
jgi:signal transduction histidine kinase